MCVARVRVERRLCRRWLCGGSPGFTNAEDQRHQHANSDYYSYSEPDRDAYAVANTEPNSDPDLDRHPDADWYTDVHRYFDVDRHPDRDADGKPHADGHAKSESDGD